MKPLLLLILLITTLAHGAVTKEQAIAAEQDQFALGKRLTLELSDAKAEITNLTGQLSEEDETLDASQQQVVAVQQQANALKNWGVEQQARADKAEAADLKDKAEAILQTRLAWKWRLISFGTWALLVAFFVARQYLPFLKIF
jgi:hypothetical protein